MNTVLLIARVLLAGVFVVAALGKLADLDGSRGALAEFGVPARLAPTLGVALPLIEIGIAAALLPASSAPYGAAAATVLLVAFAAAIARSIARGEAPDCHCFGVLHSEPAGGRTLVRNGVLLALAAFVLVAGWQDAGTSATAWVSHLGGTAAVALVGGILLLALAAAMAAAVLALVRQNGRLLLRLDELEARLGGEGDAGWAEAEAHDGLPIGTPVPPFRLSGLYGETITLGALIAAEKPLLLLFTDPACGPCNALLPEIAAWQTEHADDLTFAVLTRGSADDNRAKVREHGVTGVWLDADLAVYSSLQAIGTPSATLIDVDGRVASPIVAGEKAIAQLVTQAAGGFPVLQVGAPQHPPVPPRLAVGAPVPGIELPDLNGHTVELASVDRDTLVLFWNPGCSFCRQMLDELREWESAPPPNAPRLVLVSTGTVEDNIEMNLASEVLLDQAFAAGAAFGTTGTPSAVLVGRDGRIASALAVGATEVMSLARL
jgi:thiol-disulfide isomerase/thioredoxin/uncharacterized membrane protein YphA (DoxX/SURF4 family)